MILRAARNDDAAQIAAIYAPHVTSGIVTFETEVPDADAIGRRIAAAGDLYPWIVAVEDEENGDAGRVLGYACASRFRERAAYRWAVETSIYVAADGHERGTGRRLYAALLSTLRRQGFTAAIGVIALPNPASVALHEALGFTRAGVFPRIGYKHDRWIDVGYWQCDLANCRVPAAEPRGVGEVGIADE